MKIPLIERFIAGLGITDQRALDRINTFFAMTASYLHAMTKQGRETFIRIALSEIIAHCAIDTKETVSPETAAKFVSDTTDVIGGAQEAYIAALVRDSAPHVAAPIMKKVGAILDRLPEVGRVLELAPHADLAFVGALLNKKKIAHDDVIVVAGIPNASDWRASRIQTVVINAMGMRVLASVLVEFANSLATQTLSAFAIVIHEPDLVVNTSAHIATEPVGSDAAISVISVSEKKNVAVSDVIHVI